MWGFGPEWGLGEELGGESGGTKQSPVLSLQLLQNLLWTFDMEDTLASNRIIIFGSPGK